MGRRALHTQEEVFAAADLLAERGQPVAPASLRQALGGGSLTTIYKHHGAWSAARSAKPVPALIAMPDEVRQAFARCWQAAASEAGREITTIRATAQADVVAMRQGLEEAIASIAQLEAEQEAESARLEGVNHRLEVEGEVGQAAARDAAAREAGLVAKGQQLEEQLARSIADLAELHARERANIQATAAAKAEAVKLTDQLKDQKNRSAEVIAKCETSKQRMEGDLMTANRALRDVSGKLAKAVGQVEALTAQVASQAETLRRFSPIAARS